MVCGFVGGIPHVNAQYQNASIALNTCYDNTSLQYDSSFLVQLTTSANNTSSINFYEELGCTGAGFSISNNPNSTLDYIQTFSFNVKNNTIPQSFIIDNPNVISVDSSLYQYINEPTSTTTQTVDFSPLTDWATLPIGFIIFIMSMSLWYQLTRKK